VPALSRLLVGIALAAAPVSAAQAQDVAHFLVRVDRLLARGPFALLSPDFYRLKGEIEADGRALKREYALAKARSERTRFCPPAKGKPKVGKHEFLAALRAVPVARRSTTDTKDVLRDVLERKYPCAV
jgi:hypothetical protein